MKIKVKHLKEKLEVELADDSTVGALKEWVKTATKIPVANQRLVLQGKALADDGATLAAAGVKDKSVLMVTGSTAEEAFEAAIKPVLAAVAAKEEAAQAAQAFCELPQHAKVLAAGPPENPEVVGNAAVGNRPLPVESGTRVAYLRDLVDGHKTRVRMRLVTAEGMMVLATESAQRKLPLTGIARVTSEPITTDGGKHDGYCVVILHLAESANSKIHLYWYPVQHVENLKQILFGF